jgi:hypothetical protein
MAYFAEGVIIIYLDTKPLQSPLIQINVTQSGIVRLDSKCHIVLMLFILWAYALIDILNASLER